MGVARPPRKKPTSYDEMGRVLRIYDELREEISKRIAPTYAQASIRGYPVTFSTDTKIEFGPERFDILEVAERIAARTDDGDRA